MSSMTVMSTTAPSKSRWARMSTVVRRAPTVLLPARLAASSSISIEPMSISFPSIPVLHITPPTDSPTVGPWDYFPPQSDAYLGVQHPYTLSSFSEEEIGSPGGQQHRPLKSSGGSLSIPRIVIVEAPPTTVSPSDYFPPQSDSYLRIAPPLGVTVTGATHLTISDCSYLPPESFGGSQIPMVLITPPSDTLAVDSKDYFPPQSDKYLRAVPLLETAIGVEDIPFNDSREFDEHDLGTLSSLKDLPNAILQNGGESNPLPLPFILKVTSPDERDEYLGISPPLIDFPSAVPNNADEFHQLSMVDTVPPLPNLVVSHEDLTDETYHFPPNAMLQTYSNFGEQSAVAPTSKVYLEDSLTRVDDALPSPQVDSDRQIPQSTLSMSHNPASADAYDERDNSMSVPQLNDYDLLDASKMEHLIARLAGVCKNKKEYRKILACRGSNAQHLLDMFQQLLDAADKLSSSVRRHFIAAAQRLAEKSELYPTCYELDNVTNSGTLEGAGGFADIYKGILCGQAVCLKTVRLQNRQQSEHFFKVVCKEAILWGQLRHPNILPFYGVYRYKSMASFVAPWMVNGDIQAYLKYHKDSNRVPLASDVAQGLQFLHQNCIVHGDIKGGNILINEYERACIADFGLSSVSDKEILTWTSQATLFSKGGTARWQAPEILDPEGEEGIHNTTASDIYAWACVAYEIFADQLPFAHLTRNVAVTTKVLSGQRPRRPPDSSSSWSVWGLTKEIWALMETCWNADPGSRPAIGSVIEQLEELLPPDAKMAEENDHLSPGQFREMTRHIMDENELSVERLESILNSVQE